MNAPKVSVITAVYNGAPFLDKYFNSLLNQTLEEIEIICVNNVSKDNSLEILKEYAKLDKRIIVLNNTENNIGGAINLAIKKSSAKYICPIDQDDWVDIKMFKTLIDYSENETADMVCSNYYEYYNDSDIRKTINIPIALSNSLENIKRNALVNGCRLYTNIIKKDLILENNLFYPENLFYPDNAIGAVLYCKAEKIVNVNDHFYYYRIDNSSLTRSKDNYRFFDRLKTANIFMANMKECDLYEKYKQEADYCYYKLFYKNSITGCFSRFSRYPTKYINQIKNEFKQSGIEIKRNTYYIIRHKTYEDFIISFININTHLGYILFHIYKLIIPYKNLFVRKIK